MKGTKCRLCGCTDDTPCMTPEGPCSWVTKNTCSACVVETEHYLVPKDCYGCANIIKENVPTSIYSQIYTCSKGRFDGKVPAGHQWFAWSGIVKPNKTVAKAQFKCPYFEVHPRYIEGGPCLG